MGENDRMSLPELVMIQMGCRNSAELGRLDRWQKRYLAEQLERLDPEKPCLNEWNRLLKLLLAVPAENSCREARARLLSGLRLA